MNGTLNWLPPLVLLTEHGGNWPAYLEAIYRYFQADFVASKPSFQGRRFGLKRHPMEQGKEATFWHLISEGKTEADRLPDLRRCERIRWPRPMIEAVATGRVKCWRSQRRGEDRIYLAVDDFSYLVVLADRGEYVLLWTAFCVERGHTRRKLEREYKNSPKC